LTTQANAQDEADRVLALYAGRRDFIDITIKLTINAVTFLDIGRIVSVAIPRYGYDDELPMIITGLNYNTSTDTMVIELWGGADQFLDALVTGLDLGGQLGYTNLGSISSPGIDRTIDLGAIV